MKRVDLHMHSHVSDGDVSPAEVVRLAESARLDVIALTDHDTAAGVQAAMAASQDAAVEVVPGIEISTRTEGWELHILGYWIDPDAESIQNHQRHAVKRRYDRMVAMVAKLQDLGIGVTMDDVERAAGEEVKVLGRPHLARALLEQHFTTYFAEAFDRFIGDGGPAHVAEGFPDPLYAIEAIHSAGGVAVWAHPPLEYLDDGIGPLARWCLDGVECFRPGTSPADVDRLVAAADRHDLLVTGGSDWHGPRRSTLGDFAINAERVAKFLEVGGIHV